MPRRRNSAEVADGFPSRAVRMGRQLGCFRGRGRSQGAEPDRKPITGERRRARQPAEPDPPPRNSGGIKPSTVAGSGPNTRNPAGGADGVWVGSVGGIAAKTRDWTAGIGGRAVQLAINHLVARRSGEVQAGGSHLPSAPSTHLRSAEPGHRRATYSVASGQRKKWTLLWLQHGRGRPWRLG